MSMNLMFAGLLIVLSLIFLKRTIIKTKKLTVNDERTEFVGLKASRATFVIFTITIAISSFVFIFFGQYGRVPSNYLYYLGVIMSYLTSLIIIIYTILYVYFNKKS
jgi:uncharacterized membrane protein